MTTSQGRSGVRADRGYSYQRLEKIATYVRNQLSCSPTEALNALRLFDCLDITVRDRTGQDIPVRGVSLNSTIQRGSRSTTVAAA